MYDPQTKYYALFKDGKQISKAHSSPDAVAVEAFERKLVVCSYRNISLDEGYTIEKVKK